MFSSAYLCEHGQDATGRCCKAFGRSLPPNGHLRYLRPSDRGRGKGDHCRAGIGASENIAVTHFSNPLFLVKREHQTPPVNIGFSKRRIFVKNATAYPSPAVLDRVRVPYPAP